MTGLMFKKIFYIDLIIKHKVKTKLKHIMQFCLLAMLILITNPSNAQQSDEYSILFTGNVSEGLDNADLIKNWQKTAQDSENLAFLLLGNIFEPSKSKFSNKLFFLIVFPTARFN